LRPITLRGAVDVDPRRQDFFRTIIEEGKRLASNTVLSAEERARLDKALKVPANTTVTGEVVSDITLSSSKEPSTSLRTL